MLTTHVHPVPVHGPTDGSRNGPRQTRSAGEWERANRLGLLLIHSLIGMSAGLLILFSGTATVFDAHDSWARPLTGGLALVGGALLFAGLARAARVVRLEVAGLVVLALWDLTMTLGFVASAVATGQIAFTWPWAAFGELPATRLYPIVLYAGLFLMMCVHLVTLRQVRRADMRPRLTVARAA